VSLSLALMCWLSAPVCWLFCWLCCCACLMLPDAVGGSVSAGFIRWVYIGVYMLGAYGLDIALKRYKTRFKAGFAIVAGLYAWCVMRL